MIGIAATVAVLPAATAQARRTAYVTGINSSTVAALHVAPDGTLHSIAGSPFATGTFPRGVSLTPDGTHAYVANTASYSVSTYSVGADGGLTAAGATPVGTEPVAIASSPDGAHLYVTNSGGGTGGKTISGFAIRPDGSLKPLAGSAYPAGGDPFGIALTPDGRFLYVALYVPFGPDSVSGFAVAEDGTLAPLTPASVAVGDYPRGVSVTPDGNHLYVASLASNTISTFDIGPTGNLTPVGTPTATGTGTHDVTVTPDGAFLYVVNFSSHTVSEFSIAADSGALTPLTTAPTGSGPMTVAVTPDGRHLYTTNYYYDTISAFDIGSDGRLIPMTGSPYPANAENPGFPSLAISPNQGPTAGFTATARPAGQSTRFDGSGSSDPDGTVARYDWSFGDGQDLPDDGPTPSHTYSSPGTYTATLTVTDDERCSASRVFTGHIVLCNGGTRAVARRQVVVPDVTPPDLTLSGKKRQKADAAVEVTVSCDEQCTVLATGKLIAKVAGGKLAKRKAFKLKQARASLAAAAVKTLHLRLPRTARIAFRDDAAGRTRARLKVVATDAAGNQVTEKRRVKLTPKR